MSAKTAESVCFPATGWMISMPEIQLRIRVVSHALPMHIQCRTSADRVHIIWKALVG
jgi:hypothetical protein